MGRTKRYDDEENLALEKLQNSLDEAEELLRKAGEATGDAATDLREKAMSSLNRTRRSLTRSFSDVQENVVDHGRKAVNATSDYVNNNPWQSIGIAGLAGLLVGMLIARK